MTPRSPRAFNPNWCTHPGDHLAECVEISGLSQAEFARKARLTPKLLSTILRHKAPVRAATALKLAKITHIKAQMWMALQSSWDLFHAKKSRGERP